MARVELEGLTKRFGAVTAVENLNLDVDDGGFVCILGPSGCGKTTTLRMIAGLEKPDGGIIRIGDRVVNDLPPPERDIAMVFQFYAIYPGMTVYENLAFPLKQKKLAKREIDKRIKETASMLRIEGVLDRDAMSLTAGEKQRIALGRAYVRNPQVFLLDEPLTNLDAGLRAHMRVELKRLQKEVGQTTIYVTHDQLEGMTMADKIAVMKLGELQQFDTPDNLFNHPSNLFVAGFVGSPTMNLLDCHLQEKSGKLILEFGTFSLDVSKYADIIEKKMSGSEMIMGIRPTDILLYKKKDGEIECKVDVTELIGDEIIVDLSLGDKIIRAIAPRTFAVSPGENLKIKFDLERIHLFDKRSENAIL